MTKIISYIKRIFHLCLFGKEIEEKVVEKRTSTSQPTDNSDSLSIPISTGTLFITYNPTISFSFE